MANPPGSGHPLCPRCDKAASGTCTLHAARSPAELARACASELRARRGVGLANWYEALFAGATELPSPMVDELRVCSLRPVAEEFQRLLDVETFNTHQLRRLAALAQTLAVLAELQTADEEADGPIPPRRR